MADPDSPDNGPEEGTDDAGPDEGTDDGPDAASEGTVDADEAFEARLAEARRLLDTDVATAVYAGVVREGSEVDTTFAQRADDPRQEGMQALSLLASHLRLVADEAGVDYETVAADAVTLASRLDELREPGNGGDDVDVDVDAEFDDGPDEN